MALKTSIIHCLLDAEPQSYHANPALAVNLGFECPTDVTRAEVIGDDDAAKAKQKVLADDETQAKERFQTFLANAQEVQFHLFEAQPDDPLNPASYLLVHKGAVDKTSDEPATDMPAQVTEWLAKAQPDDVKIHYWTTFETTTDTAASINAETASATYRLRAAHSWNAPVAHRLGLTHILRPTSLGAPKYVILPFFKTPAEPVPDIPGLPVPQAFDLPEFRQWDFIYGAGDTMGDITCRTQVLDTLTLFTAAPETLDDFLTADGYLTVDPDAENLWRVTNWFEARAASLMATTGALAGPGAGAGTESMNDSDFDKIFPWGYGFVGTIPTLIAPAPAWLAATSLVAALDSVVLSILKPVSGNDSAGDILAPLLLALLDRFDETIADAFDLNAGDLEMAKLTAALRAVLKANNPVFMQANVPPLPLDRIAIATCLRLVHAIDLAPKDTSIETRLLDALLTCYSTDAAAPITADLKSTILDKESTFLRRALAETEKRLQDEMGVEAAILKLIEHTHVELPRLFAEAYLVEIEKTGNTNLADAVKTAFIDVWAAYRGLLESPFNGAEAVRRASAGEFNKALLSFAKTYPPVSTPETPVSKPQHLINVATAADYHVERILRPTPPVADDPSNPVHCFQVIADSLARLRPPAGFDQTALDSLNPFLKTSYAAAMAPMARVIESSARFIPDNAPAPLPIQIASNIDGANIDRFAHHFNGIGIAIRRIDANDNTDRWAHANLADLTWPVPPPPKPGDAETEPNVSAAIHPMLPAVSDGRGPMFIEYQGLPLAATTFRHTAADFVAATSGKNIPFYICGAPDLEAATDFAKVPRLAYGRMFQTFSFATTNAGTLPLKLQRQVVPPEGPLDARPWMPDKSIKAPQKDGDFDPGIVSTTAYQRRTAIGQMAVNEVPVANRPLRIGVPIEGIVPLSEDYPRTVIAASDCVGVRDIFRDRDGSGTLGIPAIPTKRIEWRVSDVLIRGTPARLMVRLFDRAPASPIDLGIATLELSFENFAFETVNTLAFAVESVETGTGDFARMLSVTCGSLTKQIEIGTADPIEAGWIRLTLESATAAALSFAITDDLKPYEVGAPLLVLAPDGGAWKDSVRPSLNKDGVRSPITVDIATPRVGYLDFERWFANADLRNTAFRDPKTGVVNDTAADKLRRALLTAYVLRDADENLARALDRLPDPAVDGLRIELAIQDQLASLSPPTCFVHADIFFGQKLLGIAQKIKAGQSWTPKLLNDLVLRPIEKEFSLSISLTAGDFGLSSDGLKVNVPAGFTARLSLDALVANRHFEALDKHPSVFHKGLRQHAPRTIVQSGTNVVYLAYPSAALRIETMLNGMHEIDAVDQAHAATKQAIALAADMVAMRPIDHARRYDLQTRRELPLPDRENRTRQWRLLSEIDVTTQRWRPSGRPIYNHIDPSTFRDAAALSDPPAISASHAAMPVKENPSRKVYPLSRFEQEAFFDRPNIDSQTVTQRLLPLPSKTVLEQHFWDAPSASFFRHRFTLRSRYAGALKAVSDREVKAWNTSRETRVTPSDAWTLRVAMLADLSRMLLTRPQQRALIPLTTAPRDDDGVPGAPPVLAILQEPPFSRGGLADRIAAEIKTGFGYGFEGIEGATVEIRDSRKEIGPDPRLSYRATKAEAALGMALSVEGPIGLTFDQVNAAAPAFPNSMISLSPIQLSGARQNLEEHFLGVSMRRYIDPNWTIDSCATDPLLLDAERCWWIDHDAGLAPEELLNYIAEGVDAPLLKLTIDENIFVIRTMKAAVDGGIAGAAVKEVIIARWDGEHADRLTVLHQPVAPGRYSTSVFVLLKDDQGNVRRGRGNAPLLICNFEWGPPSQAPDPAAGAGGQVKARRPATVMLKAKDARARSTMASAPTFLAWTRMGRNFDIIYSPDFLEGNMVLSEIPTRELFANLDDADATLALSRSGIGETWLCSSTFLKPFPVHVQRHLAVLTTGYLREPGRPVEEYCRSALLVGRRSAQLNGIAQQEDCLRIVEFETPAAILCSAGVSVPETYKKAYFDLVATGFQPAGGPASARLFFRFAGPPAHLRKFKTVEITLAYTNGGPDGGLVEHLVVVELANTPADTFATAIELFVERTDASAKLVYRSVVIRSDGETTETKHPAPADERGLLGADNHSPGFFVSLAAGPDEFWADVSLLHSSRPTFDGRFDFDWLFSKAGGAEPALDVSPAGLNAMVEAQARIIAVSPPVPVQPKPAD